jgi:hypothetical protein
MNKTVKLLFDHRALQINMLLDWLRSPLLHVGLLFTISLVVLLQYGLNHQPIIGDRAYLVYMGQVVYRGNLLYESTTFGYTPYGPLLSAISMHIGEAFNLPSYLAPRYLSVPIAALNSCLLYFVARNASGSALLSVISGLILSGFDFMNTLCVTNLEPKPMVVFFMLISMLALQKRNWALAGFGSAMAAMFWQPAVIITITMVIILVFHGRDTFRSAFIRYSLGMILGLLPALLYLTVYHEWNNFILLAITRKALVSLPTAASYPFRWPVVSFESLSSESPILIFAAVGLFGFAIKNLIRNGGRRVKILMDTKNGGLILLTVAWFLFNSIEFNNLPDLVPLLPLISYWAALFIHKLIKATVLILQTFKPVFVDQSIIKPTIALTSCILLGVFLFRDAFLYSPTYTLADQKILVKSTIDCPDASCSFIALNAEEFYVLTEKQSTLRYTRMEKWVDLIIDLLEPGGSNGFIKRLAETLPPLLIIRETESKSVNLERIKSELLSEYNVYRVTTRNGQIRLYQK